MLDAVSHGFAVDAAIQPAPPALSSLPGSARPFTVPDAFPCLPKGGSPDQPWTQLSLRRLVSKRTSTPAVLIRCSFILVPLLHHSNGRDPTTGTHSKANSPPWRLLLCVSPAVNVGGFLLSSLHHISRVAVVRDCYSVSSAKTRQIHLVQSPLPIPRTPCIWTWSYLFL